MLLLFVFLTCPSILLSTFLRVQSLLSDKTVKTAVLCVYSMSCHTVRVKKASSRETLHTQTHTLACPMLSLGFATVCMRLLHVHMLGLCSPVWWSGGTREVEPRVGDSVRSPEVPFSEGINTALD